MKDIFYWIEHSNIGLVWMIIIAIVLLLILATLINFVVGVSSHIGVFNAK
jgi:hypothetical protein